MSRARTRPLGRLTRRPLPTSDPSIDALTPPERRVLTQLWVARINSEHTAVGAFDYVAATLAELGAPRTLIELARRSVDDEQRHEEIARRMTRVYGGEGHAMPALEPFRARLHPGASPELVATLHITSIGCLTETTGSALLEHSLEITTAPLARAAVREILTDEVDHARIGWAWLARCGRELRDGVTQWLPTLIENHLATWLPRRAYRPSAAVIAQGFPSSQQVREVVLGTLEQVILPGLEAQAMETAEARRTIHGLASP